MQRVNVVVMVRGIQVSPSFNICGQSGRPAGGVCAAPWRGLGLFVDSVIHALTHVATPVPPRFTGLLDTRVQWTVATMPASMIFSSLVITDAPMTSAVETMIRSAGSR